MKKSRITWKKRLVVTTILVTMMASNLCTNVLTVRACEMDGLEELVEEVQEQETVEETVDEYVEETVEPADAPIENLDELLEEVAPVVEAENSFLTEEYGIDAVDENAEQFIVTYYDGTVEAEDHIMESRAFEAYDELTFPEITTDFVWKDISGKEYKRDLYYEVNSDMKLFKTPVEKEPEQVAEQSGADSKNETATLDATAVDKQPNKDATEEDEKKTEQSIAEEETTAKEAGVEDEDTVTEDTEAEDAEVTDEEITDDELLEDSEVAETENQDEEKSVVGVSISAICKDTHGTNLQDTIAITESGAFADFAPQIDGYTFAKAFYNDDVASDIVAEVKNTEEGELTIYTIDGERVKEDATVIFVYVSDTASDETEKEKAATIELNASCVDEEGNPIDAKYTNMGTPAFGSDGILLLNQGAPIEVSVRQMLFKVTKYDYVKASINGTTVAAVKQIPTEDGYGYAFSVSGTDWTELVEDSELVYTYTIATGEEEEAIELPLVGSVHQKASRMVFGKVVNMDYSITIENPSNEDKELVEVKAVVPSIITIQAAEGAVINDSEVAWTIETIPANGKVTLTMAGFINENTDNVDNLTGRFYINEEKIDDVSFSGEWRLLKASETEGPTSISTVCDGVSINVSAADGSVLPAGTEVRATRVGADGAKAAIEGATDDIEVKDAMAFDITLVVNGEEVQPDGSVVVTFSDIPLNASGEEETLTVVHMAGSTSIDGQVEVDGGNEISIEADHFSVYVIAVLHQIKTIDKSYEKQNTVSKVMYNGMEYDLSSLAYDFHIFANNVTLNADTNGNIACNNIDAKHQGIGCKQDYASGINSFNYIGNSAANLGEIQSGSLVINSKVGYKIEESGLDVSVGDGYEIKKQSKVRDNVYVEDENSDVFIDIEAELERLANLSTQLANASTSDAVKTSLKNIEIDSEEGGLYVLNLTVDELGRILNNESISMKCNSNQMLVINIDMNGADQYALSNLASSFNGTSNSESTIYAMNNVVFNIVDSSKDDKVFTGECAIGNGRGLLGTILAPRASLTYGAINGTVICSDAKQGNCESHKSTLSGMTGSITVNKEFVSVSDPNAVGTFYFGLFSDPQGTKRVENQYIKPITVKVGGVSSAYFGNLPLNSSYYVFETDSNGNVITNVSYEITGQGQAVELTDEVPNKAVLIINTDSQEYGSLSLLKKDTEGNVVKNAYFGIFTDEACTNMVQSMSTTSAGIAWSNQLPFGQYYVKEVTAPQGYKLNPTVYPVNISERKRIAVNGGEPIIDEVCEYDEDEFVITVSKVFGGGGIWPDNAQFDFRIEPSTEQYCEADEQDAAINSARVITLTKYNPVGTFSIKVTPNPKKPSNRAYFYKITEVIPDNPIPGVIYDTEPWFVKIWLDTDQDKITQRYFVSSHGRVARATTNETQCVDYTGSVTFTNYLEGQPKDQGRIFCYKTGGEYEYTELSGAEFTVYRDEACTDVVDVMISGENPGDGDVGGQLGGGNTYSHLLDYGTYYVKETKAPVGHMLDETVNKVVVNNWQAILTNRCDYRYVNVPATQPNPIKLTLHAKKNLVDKNGNALALNGRTFTFNLSGDTSAQATSDANGDVTFAPIEYTEAGTYNYTITENADSAIKGITYSTEQYTVVVTVEEQNGQLVATPAYKKAGEDVTQAVFTNTYIPVSTDTKAMLRATKTLRNADVADYTGKFSFELKDSSGTVLQTKTNDASNGSLIVFDDLTFNEEGTYQYTISEVTYSQGGIASDTNIYKAVVTVADDNGELKASTSYQNASGADISGITFENIYTTSEAEFTPHATKQMNPDSAVSKALSAGQFEFTISGTDYSDTATNDASGNVTFDTIKYSQAGTYTYTIKETNGGAAGYVYDDSEYELTVEVADNRAGQLVATQKAITKNGQAASDVVFVNDYVVGSVEYDPAAVKDLVGKEFADAISFSFTMKEIEGGDYVSTVSNNGAEVHFDKITYTEPGTHKYTVKENGTDGNGYIYDKTVYTVTVNVIDNGDGTLRYTKSVSGGEGNVVFHNSYEVTPTNYQPSATKTLTGKDLVNGAYSFTLSENDTVLQTKQNSGSGISFDAIEYREAGIHTYTIKEVAGNEAGVTYDGTEYTITVNVVDNAGVLVASSEISNGTETVESITFENSYQASEVVVPFSASKTLMNGAQPMSLEGKTFTFQMKDADDNVISEATNDAAGNVVFDSIKYDTAGTYTYTIQEVATDVYGGITCDNVPVAVTVVVTDNVVTGKLEANVTYMKNGVSGQLATFVNHYNTSDTELVLHATKYLEGRTIEDNMFTFQVLDKDNKVVRTATNIGNDVIFDKFEYSQPGEYRYTVKESGQSENGFTIDTKSYSVVVTVVDNGDGTLVPTAVVDGDANATMVFNNTYTAEKTSYQLEARKNLLGTGLILAKDDYTFNLVGSTGTYTAKNDADGNVVFPEIEYTAAGEYTYTISEQSGSKPGVTYDTSSYRAVVTVTDDGQGQLEATAKYYTAENGVVTGLPTFNNQYQAEKTSFIPMVRKVLNGPSSTTLQAGKFKFTLSGAGNYSQTIENTASGVQSFNEIEFTKVGTYTYTVVEENTELPGYSYSNVEYTITVDVTDDGNGQLIATPTYVPALTDGYMVFTNTYETGTATFQAVASKTLTGAELKADQFEFVLKSKDGATISAKNAADGSVTFAEQTYTQAGTYEYTLYELGKESDLEGITYDSTVYDVVVTVTDDGAGNLVADGKYYNNNAAITAATFTNEYKAEGTSFTPKATKVLNGATIKADQFSFTLTGEGVSETKTNNGAGVITFSSISYDKAGNYTYTIKEVPGDVSGYTYDDSEQTIEVKVSDDGKGALFVENVTYNGGSASGITFTNKYEAQPTSYTFEATKSLTGAELQANQFTFRMAGGNNAKATGNVYVEVPNAADGKISFGTIEYTETGIYTYEISEVTGSNLGIKYDETKYTVVVEVTDDEAGRLHAVAKVNGVEDAAVTFTNEYKANPTTLVLQANKRLTGKALEEGKFSFVLKDTTGNEIETVSNAADGSITFAELSYDTVGSYEYTISEIPGNDADYTYSDAVFTVSVVVTDNKEGKLVAVPTYSSSNVEFVNRYNPSMEVSGVKHWDDSDNQDGVRPDSIKVILKQNGAEYATKTVTAADSWAYTFTELPTYDEQGNAYTYTIAEDETALGGYTLSQIEGYDLYNTYAPELTSLIGNKVWMDSDDADGFRPESITVYLLADGQRVEGKSVVVSDANGWHYEFVELPKFKDGGTEIVYTVEEDAVEGYVSSLNGNDLINTHDVKKVEISGTKNWYDGGDVLGLRPATITINLLANGEVVNTATITGPEWSYKFDELPKYKDGELIVYTIEEVSVDGYTSKLIQPTMSDDSNAYVVDIANTLKPVNVAISGIKNWAQDNASVRPASIEIHLLQNGEVIDRVTTSADQNWLWSFGQLPKFDDSMSLYTYTVEEVAIPNYSTTYSVDNANPTQMRFTINNTYAPGTTAVSGIKTWDDSNNADNIRPDSITIILYRNGVEVDTANVTAADGWSWAFSALPIEDENGKAYTYTIGEAGVEGYTTTVYGYNVTNTHRPEGDVPPAPPTPEEPTPTPDTNIPEEPIPRDSEVLGARRGGDDGEGGGVLGARRNNQSVLGARRAAKTGDQNQMAAWAMAMGASAAACAAWFGFKRKDKKDK